MGHKRGFLDTTEVIGNKAFYHCTRLTKVFMGNSLKTIENGAFIGTKALKAVDIPESIVYIRAHAFFDSGIKSISIKGSPEIEATAFSNCPKFPLVTGDNNALYEYEVAAPNATLKVVSCPKEMLVYEYVQRINSGNTLIYVLYGGEYFAVKIDNEIKVCDLENMKELIKFHSLF